MTAFSARAGFAKNLFEAGGLETPGNDGFDSADAVAAAYAQSGAQLACLCSSDTLYAERAIDTVKALVAAGARGGGGKRPCGEDDDGEGFVPLQRTGAWWRAYDYGAQ